MDKGSIRRDLTIIALINLQEDYINALEDIQDEQLKTFVNTCIYEITLYLNELIGEVDSEPIKKPKWNQG